MINQELLKKLHDNGFPFKEHDDDGIGEALYGHLPYSVTLSELIEACGDGVILFHDKENNIWCAAKIGSYSSICYDYHYIDDSLSDLQKANTPEEAVSNLWIEIKT